MQRHVVGTVVDIVELHTQIPPVIVIGIGVFRVVVFAPHEYHRALQTYGFDQLLERTTD